MTWSRIDGFRIVAADPDRLARFYAAIGFGIGDRRAIDTEEMRTMGIAGRGERLPMILGESHVDLDSFEERGRPYPGDSDAASLVFQHLAIVTDDAAAAWARAVAAGAAPISTMRPVTLPASSGGVIAVKFRDPEGHPLEFLQFPDARARGWEGTGSIGIDHSAISVSDVTASVRFLAGRGLRRGDATLNEGPSQAALDGLREPVVDVVPMEPANAGPHCELLGYRQSTSLPMATLRANDSAATRIVWRGDENALVRDPDGHLHQVSTKIG